MRRLAFGVGVNAKTWGSKIGVNTQDFICLHCCALMPVGVKLSFYLLLTLSSFSRWIFLAVRSNGIIPSPPLDLIALSKFRRKILLEGGKKLVTFANGYFHFEEECIVKKIAQFSMRELIVKDETKAVLELCHKRHLSIVIGETFVF